MTRFKSCLPSTRHGAIAGLLTIGVVIAACSADQPSATADATNDITADRGSASPSGGMSIVPVETLGEFQPLVPTSPNGPNIVVLEGDVRTGPSIAVFRYTNGYSGSRTLHTHTATYRSVLIEGEMKHWGVDGSEETAAVLRPGSYWRQPGGERHADHCLTDTCLALVTFEGPIDAHFDGGHP